MNINFIRLRGIEKHLDRIATALEALLAQHYGLHVRAPKADTSGVEPELFYSTDERTALYGELERLRREGIELPDDPADVDELLKVLREQ